MHALKNVTHVPSKLAHQSGSQHALKAILALAHVFYSVDYPEAKRDCARSTFRARYLFIMDYFGQRLYSISLSGTTAVQYFSVTDFLLK